MQASLAMSAIEKVEAAKPDQPVTFCLVLSKPMLADDERAALREMGCTSFYQSVYVASATIPARHLLDLAELPSVKRIS